MTERSVAQGTPRRELRETARELAGLSELAATWNFLSPPSIAESLAAALSPALDADFVYIRAPGRMPEDVVEAAHRRRGPVPTSKAAMLGRALVPWLDGQPLSIMQPMLNPIGEGKVHPTFVAFGEDDAGVLVAASSREPFPTERDRVILGTAAGYLALALERDRYRAAVREIETRFRHLADTAPVMIWLSEPDGTVSYQSESWYRFTGQPADSGTGDGWLEPVHPGDRARLKKAWKAANLDRASTQEEYRLRRADGEYRWVLDTAAPRFGEDRDFLGYVGSIIDISDRKKAEEQLADSERRYQMVANLVPQLIWITDAQGKPTFFNQRWYDFTGMTPGETAITNSVTHPDDFDRVWKVWNEAVVSGRPYETEYRLKKHDGTYERFLAQGLPEYDEKGTIVRWYGSCTNIDAQRKNAEALKRHER